MLEGLRANKENGPMPIAADDLDFESRLRVLMLGEPKSGKAQPLDEPVLTPTGWRPIGDLSVGDLIVGSDGQPAHVLGVYPQGRKKVVRVQTDDGAWARCCEDHLWFTSTRVETRRGRWAYAPGPHDQRTQKVRTGIEWGEGRTKNTREIRQSIGDRHFLPRISAPIVYADSPNLSYDPYFVGLLLGDGSLVGDSITFTSLDEELIKAATGGAEQLGDSGVRYNYEDRCPGVRLTGGNTKVLFRALGLLGKRSEAKEPPTDILLASVESRLAFLQGLMDTDGHATVGQNDKAKQAEYSTTSVGLRDTVVDLVRSLGGRALVRLKAPVCQTGPGLPAWSVMISFDSGLCPFRLTRKVAVWVEHQADRSHLWRQRIVSVESDGEADCSCIAVDTADSLYVTRNYLLTHNTSCVVSTAPGPVRVLLCEDISALREAKRRSPRGHFDVEQIKGWNSMQKAISEAKADAAAGKIKTLVIDPLSDFADRVLLEAFEQTKTGQGNDDGRKAYPECTKRLKHLIEQLFAMPCHVVVICHHMVVGADSGEGLEKTGKGIVPLLPGASRAIVAAKFSDIVWFDLKMSTKDGKPVEDRAIVTGPQGAWGPGCRSLSSMEVLPADITQLIERFSEQLKSDKKPRPVPQQTRPALRPVVTNNRR